MSAEDFWINTDGLELAGQGYEDLADHVRAVRFALHEFASLEGSWGGDEGGNKFGPVYKQGKANFIAGVVGMADELLLTGQGLTGMARLSEETEDANADIAEQVTFAATESEPVVYESGVRITKPIVVPTENGPVVYESGVRITKPIVVPAEGDAGPLAARVRDGAPLLDGTEGESESGEWMEQLSPEQPALESYYASTGGSEGGGESESGQWMEQLSSEQPALERYYASTRGTEDGGESGAADEATERVSPADRALMGGIVFGERQQYEPVGSFAAVEPGAEGESGGSGGDPVLASPRGLTVFENVVVDPAAEGDSGGGDSGGSGGDPILPEPARLIVFENVVVEPGSEGGSAVGDGSGGGSDSGSGGSGGDPVAPEPVKLWAHSQVLLVDPGSEGDSGSLESCEADEAPLLDGSGGESESTGSGEHPHSLSPTRSFVTYAADRRGEGGSGEPDAGDRPIERLEPTRSHAVYAAEPEGEADRE